MLIEDSKQRPNIPAVTFEMLMGVMGMTTEKWERPAGWLLTGFAAVVALMVSNYDKIIAVIGAGAMHSVVILFFFAVVAHAVQQIFSTLVQAGVAGGKVGRELKLENINEVELRQLMDGMVAAYPWPVKRFLRRRYDEILEHGLAPLTKSMVRMTATVAWSAAAQMALGIVAVGVVAWSLMWATPSRQSVLEAPTTALPAAQPPARAASGGAPR